MPRTRVRSVFSCDGAGLGGEAPRGACAPVRAPSANGVTGAGRSLLLPDAFCGSLALVAAMAMERSRAREAASELAGAGRRLRRREAASDCLLRSC